MSEKSCGLLAGLVVTSPVLVGIGYSLLASLGMVGGASLGGGTSRLRIVLTDLTTWQAVAWSMWTATAATALAFVAAVAVACLFRSANHRDRIARGLAILPLPVPHVVAALLAVLVMGQSGLLARIAFTFGWISEPAAFPGLIYDTAGIGFIVTLAAKETPFLALVAFSVMASRSGQMEETARTLGATSGQVFREVEFPLLWRGMLPATVAVFVFVFGTFEAAALLAPSQPTPLPVLAMERYSGASLDRRADAFVLSLVAFGVAATAVAVHEILRRRTWDLAR